MSEYIDKSKAVGEGYLQDWYISSVSEDDEPVWTEGHIEELAKDFIVIPKDTPAADVAPVVHGRWVYHNFDTICSECRKSAIFDEWEQQAETEFCPHCGAKMDKEV